jgi:hypothetical protein
MSEFTDTNARQVHSFALQMGNLGLSRVADLLLAMQKSNAWREFKDGTGLYRFLPGEFDYFLTQQGVTRDVVINSVRDVKIKAELEEAMDERRTGDRNYRRRLAEVRAQLPNRPGHPIEPFGYTKSELHYLESEGEHPAPPRLPLGRAPRQYRMTAGVTTKRPGEQLDARERIRRAVFRLPDEELQSLADSISQELARRASSRQA